MLLVRAGSQDGDADMNTGNPHPSSTLKLWGGEVCLQVSTVNIKVRLLTERHKLRRSSCLWTGQRQDLTGLVELVSDFNSTLRGRFLKCDWYWALVTVFSQSLFRWWSNDKSSVFQNLRDKKLVFLFSLVYKDVSCWTLTGSKTD